MRLKINRNLPAIGAAVRSIIIFISVMSIPLSTADTLGLSEAQTSSWILAIYGLAGVLGLALALIYRQPLVPTGNIFLIIFITRLGTRLTYAELIGATVLAGAVVLLVGLLGLTDRLAKFIPVPIVFGLLAGVVLTFVADIFNQMENAPLLVAGSFLAYLASRRLLGDRLPAIFAALVTGLAIAVLTGQFGRLSAPLSLEVPQITLPEFSLSAVLTATPVMVVLITIQANLPSLRYLHSQDYRPPDRVINAVSGLGTMLGSLMGPTGISLSLPATALVAGPEAGEHQIRHRTVYLAAGAATLVGLLASIATAIAAVIPTALLLSLAGLALVDVLRNSLERIVNGRLVLGPLFTFAITFSDVTFLGFGSFFWALVIGTAVSVLVEQDAVLALRKEP